jgi:uncharacterized radical SAM superfamily protein
VRNRYWTYDKDYAKRNLEGLIESLESLAAQELDTIIEQDLMEFEGHNAISIPPSHTALFQALKNARKVYRLIEEGAYPSMEKKD